MCCYLITHCVFLLLLATGIHSQTNKCPDPQEILPCNCAESALYGTDIYCSAVESNEELNNVFNREFDSNNFGRLFILKNFYLETIRAGDLGNVSFVEIWMADGKLERVEPLAFAGSYLTARNIFIFNNDLVSFPYEELPDFTVLEDIYFDYNKILSFPDGLKSDSLTGLHFEGNKFDSLPADALQGLTNLHGAYFFDCNISTILPGTFTGLPNLNWLELSENNIQNLSAGSIELHGDLSFLGMKINRIENIEPNAFSGVTGSLDAAYNKLKFLPEDVWEPSLEAGAQLHIRGNPFVCGCDMAWLVLNSTLLARVETETTCEDGTRFIDLDPAPFEDC